MDTYIKIIALTISVAIALWLLLDAAESESEPDRQTRIKLFCSGFAVGFSVVWLINGGSFTDLLGIKLLAGFVGGLKWAYWVTGVIRKSSSGQKTDFKNENR